MMAVSGPDEIDQESWNRAEMLTLYVLSEPSGLTIMITFDAGWLIPHRRGFGTVDGQFLNARWWL